MQQGKINSSRQRLRGGLGNKAEEEASKKMTEVKRTLMKKRNKERDIGDGASNPKKKQREMGCGASYKRRRWGFGF